MVNCMVKSCKNRGKIPGVTYHQIPKKNSKPWFDALKRRPGSLRNVVCSKHFKPEELKGGKHRYLKQGAVPSLLLGNSCRTKLPSIDQSAENSEISEDILGPPEVEESDQQIPANISSHSDSNTQNLSEETAEANKTVTVVHNGGIFVVTKKEITLEGKCRSVAEMYERKDDNQNESADDSSSDSMGLKGSLKEQRQLVYQMHSYGKSPKKCNRYSVKGKYNSLKVRDKLRITQQRNRKLNCRVSNLRKVIINLKKKLLVSQDALNHLARAIFNENTNFRHDSKSCEKNSND